MSRSDFFAVHEYASDPDAIKYMWWGPNTENDAAQFIEAAVEQQSANARSKYDMAIVARDSGMLIGCVSLYEELKEHRVFELGYCLSKHYWGKGFATEAITGLLELAFERLEIDRIISQVDPRNIPSNTIMQSLGFVLERTLVDNIQIRSEWCSTHVYSLSGVTR